MGEEEQGHFRYYSVAFHSWAANRRVRTRRRRRRTMQEEEKREGEEAL